MSAVKIFILKSSEMSLFQTDKFIDDNICDFINKII